MSDKYLQGFNDVYKKAMEMNRNSNFNILQTKGYADYWYLNAKEIAEEIYKDVTELQERDKRIGNNFNAE